MQSSHPLYVASVVMMTPYRSKGGTSSRLMTHDCVVVKFYNSLPSFIAAWPLLPIVQKKNLKNILSITLVYLVATAYTSFLYPLSNEGKGKATPITGLWSLEGSGRLRLQITRHSAHEGGKVAFTPRNILVLIFRG